MRGYKTEVTETSMQGICESYFSENMVKKPTCFKNPSKPTCIDLITTNLECFRTLKHMKQDYQIFIN